MATIITIKNKEGGNLLFSIKLQTRESFTETGLLKTVEKYYKSLYGFSDVKADLIPIGGGYTDIEVKVQGSKRVLIWSFAETIPFVYD